MNLDAFPAIFDSSSLSPTNVDITIPRQNQEVFNESFSTDAPQTDYITEVPLINNFVADGLPADNDSEIMLFLRNEFQSLKIQLDSTNALLRQNLGLSKQNSKNMKTYFDNQSFEGFLSEYEIFLPVSSEIALRDLEMRILNDDFRKSFVSFLSFNLNLLKLI